MNFIKTYPVLKNIYAVILLVLIAFQCEAGGMLDTASVEWNKEVDKCVVILNENIARNKDIEDSILADRHFNFNQIQSPLEINEQAKVEEDVTSYMYITDRNNFNFISDASKKNLDGRLRALQFNTAIAFHIMFHPSDYKMTDAEAAYFNSKVYGRSNLGSSTFNKAILILVSVNQIKSVNNYFGYQPVLSTNCNISISTGAGINPEVKNEFTNIINSVFRNAYSESEREQKYNNVFDAVYRKINFSRKIYAYEVDERGNISEELITLPSKMGNNEAATFTLHVRKPFYISGYQNDTKYYRQINPLREEYIKMYSRDFVKLITSSNFPGTYSNQYLYQPPGRAYKDEYQYSWNWATAIDAAGLVASCVGLDNFIDFTGAIYYASHGQWVDAGVYTASMFIPFVTGAVAKNLVKIVEGVGEYTLKIKWGIFDIDARPFGNKGYWGKRIPQSNPRVEAYELKINPNNESFYVEHPNGGFVQFENINVDALQDGKLAMQADNSFYRVYDKPEFLRKKVLDEATRQIEAANAKSLKVEWLVSDQTAVTQLTKFFLENNINIKVKYLAE